MANILSDSQNIPKGISISREPDLESKGTFSSCRQVKSVSKDVSSSGTTSRPLTKPTHLYKRSLSSVNPEPKIVDLNPNLVDAKLKEIQDKNGLDRANAILDLGRKTILLEGQQLDDKSVDKILETLQPLLNDSSWEVRMDVRWLIDILREEGYLDEFNLEKFEAQLSQQSKFTETDPKVIENTKKLLSNLRLQQSSISSSQAAQEKESEYQKLRADHALLQEQLGSIKATNDTLKSENLLLSEKAKLADHLGNQNTNLQSGIQQAQEATTEANNAKLELQKKLDLQAQEFNAAATKHQEELQTISTQFADVKAANEILEKTNQQQQTQIQDLLSKNHLLTQDLQIQLQQNQEQSKIIREKIEQANQLYKRADSLQNTLEETQNRLSKLQKANLELQSQSQSQRQTKESENTLSLHQQEIQKLTTQFQELKKVNDTLQETIQTQKTQISSLQATLSEQNKKLEQALKNNTALTQKAQEHHKQSQQNEESIQLLTTRNNQLQQDLKKAQEEQVSLKNTNLQLQNQSQRQTQELENLTTKHQQEIQQANTQLHQTRLENHKLNELNQSGNEKLQKSFEDIATLTQETQANEKKNLERIEALNTQNTELERNLQNLQLNKEQLEALNKSQTAQIQEFHSALSLANEKLSIENNNNQLLTQQLQESKTIEETLKADLAKKTQTNAALLAQINTLEEQVRLLTLEIKTLRTPRTRKSNKENEIKPSQIEIENPVKTRAPILPKTSALNSSQPQSLYTNDNFLGLPGVDFFGGKA